jgi:hypothetical protein
MPDDRNVAASTTETSKHNRPENGTELLPDRLAEIRARLDAWWGARYLEEDAGLMVEDIAWLLDEVCRLRAKYEITDVVMVPCDCDDCKRLAMRIGLAEATDA